MIRCNTVKELSIAIDKYKNENKSIGFVPTMGALHEGHISLIKHAASKCEIVVVSIFVNPTQFNNQNDFEKYPRIVDKDIELLNTSPTGVLWLPQVNEIYENGLDNLPKYNLGFIETILDGAYRPGHFQGVCQVVHQLLNNVKPNFLFLGQKDYQQCMVLSKLVEIEKLKTQIIICPTVRTEKGLAMSSRNMRLNDEEKDKALVIFNNLQYIKKNIKEKAITEITKDVYCNFEKNGFKIDYVNICNAKTLEIITNWNSKDKAVAVIAVFIKDIRLIDNMLLN